MEPFYSLCLFLLFKTRFSCLVERCDELLKCFVDDQTSPSFLSTRGGDKDWILIFE